MKFLPPIPKPLSNITLVYSLLQFFYYFNFFWLIQNIYFLNNGVDFKQLSILLGMLAVSVIILEIPSGILADKFGRKPIVLIGKLGYLAGMLCFVYFNNFNGFLIGMLLWGLHDAFVSGALEALIFDELKLKQKQDSFKKVLSIATVSREVGLGSGVLIAGALTQLNINYNLAGSIVIAVIGFTIALLLPNAKKSKKAVELDYIKFFKISYKAVYNSKDLKKLVLFTICVLASYQVVTEYFAVTLKELNLSFTTIGVLSFIEMLCFSIGVAVAHKLSNKEVKNLYFTLSLLMSLGILLITTHKLYTVVFAWLFLRIVKAISEVSATADWQSRIESVDRATTTSIKSFLSNGVYVPLALIFGFLADSKGLFNAFYLIAATASIYFFYGIYLRIYRHKA